MRSAVVVLCFAAVAGGQVEGEPDKAREYFEKCVATKAANLCEYTAATVALKG